MDKYRGLSNDEERNENLNCHERKDYKNIQYAVGYKTEDGGHKEQLKIETSVFSTRSKKSRSLEISEIKYPQHTIIPVTTRGLVMPMA